MNTTAQPFNYDDPLARLPGETLRAWRAFQDYEAMGEGRSLNLLTKVYKDAVTKQEQKPPTRQFATLALWSGRYHWQDRLGRLMEIRAAQRETTRLQRLKQLEDHDWQQGQALRDKVEVLLAEMEKFSQARVQETTGPDGEKLRIITLKFKPSLSQMALSAKIASELQRLSVGAATQNSRLVDKQGDDRDLPVMGIEIVAPPVVNPEGANTSEL